MKSIQIISCTLLCFFVLSFVSQVSAQASFKEVEKMRKEEEKRRAKLAQEKAKKAGKNEIKSNVNENNQWQDKGKGKNNDFPKTKAKGKKNKKGVPKASQNLSRQRQQVNNNTQKYRKGDGVTKAAKAQSKGKRKVKGGIEVW